MFDDLPPEVAAEIARLLVWFDQHHGEPWPDGEIGEAYSQYRDVIRDYNGHDLLDMTGTCTRTPGLSGYGRAFLSRVQASGSVKKRTGRPRKSETDSAQLVIAALAMHHAYEQDGSIGNYEPVGVRQLAEKNKHLTTAAISRFLNRKFPKSSGHKGHKRYVVACRDGRIGRLLAKWQGDDSEGHHGLRPEEYGRRED